LIQLAQTKSEEGRKHKHKVDETEGAENDGDKGKANMTDKSLQDYGISW